MKSIGITKSKGKNVLLVRSGSTEDIIEHLLDVIEDVRGQTKNFARQFTADKKGLRELWYWVHTNIRYEEDPLGVQWIREPARLYSDGVGDCKSFTVFIVSVLENLGLDYIVRFTNTESPGSRIVNHVYPIAVLKDGTQVIMDAIAKARFNREHTPIHYQIDYTMADIYRLSGIGAHNIGQAATDSLNTYVAELQTITANIPDSVLQTDITEMTQGEFQRFQAAQQFKAQADNAPDPVTQSRYLAAAKALLAGKVSGIGSIQPGDAAKINQFLSEAAGATEPAFRAPVLEIPSISGLWDTIADAVKTAWRKIVNWIFKTAMPAAAPFFLYTFISKNIGGKTGAKRDRQLKLLGWLQSAGKFESSENLQQAIRTGIIKKYGRQPEDVLNAVAQGEKITGIGAIVAAVIQAITVVVEIVTKVAKLFKKSTPDVSKNDAPDLDELSAEILAAKKAKAGSGKTIPNITDNGNTGQGLLIAAAAVAALLIAR